MKIAIVNSEHPSPSGTDHGGIATYTYTLARLLTKLGHTVHVLTRSEISPAHFSPSVRFHRYGFKKSSNPFIRLVRRYLRTPLAWEAGHARSVAHWVLKLHQSDGLDIVDIPEYGGLAAAYPVKRVPPCVVTFHTPSQLVDKLNGVHPTASRHRMYQFEQKGIRHATGFKVPSNALKTQVCTMYHLPETSLSMIRNPFDFSDFSAVPWIQRPNNRFDILFSGRLEQRKGAEIILNTIKDILAIGPDVSVTIAGETEIGNSVSYRRSIEQLLEAGERDRVWFPGPLPAQKLRALYASSSILLFPSLFENCSYVLLEAMASGLPVIATEGSGISEMITHGSSGLLFPPDDPELLLTHVRQLYNNRDFSERLGETASKSIRILFDPETLIAATLDFYRSVINSQRK
jgi:glycogen synthase